MFLYSKHFGTASLSLPEEVFHSMTPSTQQALTNLLRANSMTPDTLDGPTLTQLFLSQMRISLYGGESAIPMLPTFCKPFGTLAEGTPVAVAEVDDQEVRVCLVTFSGGQAQCAQRASFPVPGREYPARLQRVEKVFSPR